MSSKKKSLLGIFSICFIFVLAGVLFAFSISAASEAEVVEPAVPEQAANEEALPADSAAEESEAEEVVVEDPNAEVAAEMSAAEEANETSDLANPVGGPLEVYNSADQPATTDECTWDDGNEVYTIKANGLTFKGEGNEIFASIQSHDGSNINELTLDNVNMQYWDKTLDICTNNPVFTLNIKNQCVISSFYDNEVAIYITRSNVAATGTAVFKGDDSSSLTCERGSVSFNYFEINKITGSLSVTINDSNANALETDAKSLIFESAGKVCLSSMEGSAIQNSSSLFKLIVKNGTVELRVFNIELNEYAAILTEDQQPEIELGSGLVMLGAAENNANISECKEGVYMKFIDFFGCSISYIGDKPAGTVFIVPSLIPGGGESSETAQTWDSVPSAAIALLAIIAISSFAVLCNRKSNK